MNKERLQVLADFLLTLPVGKGKFHLREWMNGYSKFSHLAQEFRERLDNDRSAHGELDPFTRTGELVVVRDAYGGLGTVPVIEPAECRTAGCAFGWATTIPAFKEAGLKTVLYRSDLTEEPSFNNPNTPVPYFEEQIAFNAAEKFFDISGGESQHLFDPSYYYIHQRADPRFVAARIKELIKDHVDAD